MDEIDGEMGLERILGEGDTEDAGEGTRRDGDGEDTCREGAGEGVGVASRGFGSRLPKYRLRGASNCCDRCAKCCLRSSVTPSSNV